MPAKIIPLFPDAKIIRLPPRRICSNCYHGFMGAPGIYCDIFNDLVIDENADDCPMFEHPDMEDPE